MVREIGYARGVRKRSLAAKAFKLPLGDVVTRCYRCPSDVHEAELTWIYEDEAWHEVHRVCRNSNARRFPG